MRSYQEEPGLTPHATAEQSPVGSSDRHPELVRAPTGSFGAALRDLRIAAGITQEQLAERSAVSVRAIRNLEIGRTARPQRQSILLLAAALGLDETARTALLQTARRHPRSHDQRIGAEAAVPAPRTGDSSQPCELPADTATLVGRDAVVTELYDYLCELVDRPGSAPRGAMRLVTVTGAPGSGKTALAVRLARRLLDRFPDGQIYVDVQEPAAGKGILGRLLRSLGLPDPPAGDEERGALLRAVLNRRRLLLLLDNVTSERQIRPLLATTTRSAIVVASRCRLPALHGGRHVQLQALEDTEAVRMLAGFVGETRLAAEPQHANAIVRLCGRLPLAVHIAGSWLRARPHRALGELAALLTDERGRLDRLRVGDLAVTRSIEADLLRLDPALRHALGDLSRSEVVEFDSRQVAALLDLPAPVAEEIVEGLAHSNMISPVDRRDGSDTYRVDHLVRLHARHQVRLHADEFVPVGIQGGPAL